MAEREAEASLEGAPSLPRGAAVLFIAAACGWLIMQMEILGARILAPYFGSAVYVVMGSVIGVFLLSLAVGYTLGGWLSHRSASQVTLGVCIGVAGAWLCALPYGVRPLCDALLAAGFDITWGSLLAAFGLFAVPTCLLGTVSPTAVRWLTRDVTRSGFNTGLVFGVSTVASFAGCIATAFYLVRLSMRRTVTGSGLVLLALAGAILLHAWLRRAPVAEQPPAGGTE